MPYDDPSLKEFAGYFRAKEPGRRERAENWAIAIGLQKVDGLVPSKYLVSVAKQHIEGKITDAKATDLVDDYYETKEGHDLPEDVREADRVAARINQVIAEEGFNLFVDNSWYFRNALVRANYEHPINGIARDFAPLERFFRNLILGETNELQSRYLLVGFRPDEKTLFDRGSPEKRSEISGQKKRSEKSGQKTVDRLWQLLKEHPHLSQAGLVAALGITRSTIQKHIANLKAAGRLRRIGPDKGGHWEVAGASASHAENAEHAERSRR